MGNATEFFTYFAAHADTFAEASLEHAALVGTTLLWSVALAAALTVLALRSPRIADATLEILGAVYAIPSIALFALLIPFTGLGFTTAVAVMVVYNQFILVRNAIEGLRGVDAAALEAARGMGMSPVQVMLRVQLPLAAPAIVAGLRLACLSTTGIATVAATINAGGLGAILFSGLRSLNVNKILSGTLCCVALALIADGALGLVERRLSRAAGTARP